MEDQIQPVDAPVAVQEAPSATVNDGSQSPSANMHNQSDPVKPSQDRSTRAPVFAIVAAIIVGGALVAVTVFAFKNSVKEGTPAATTTQQESTVPAAATTTDIDQTSAEIDKSLKSLDDTADFPDDELSDTTLGL